MMNIGVYVNKTKDINFVVTNRLLSLLNKKKINYAVYQSYQNDGVKSLDMPNLVKFSDVIITLGGDGTILQVIKDCAKNKVPVVGINLGHLGFLLDYDKDELEELIDCLINKNYELENRTLIEIFTENGKYLALNDIVISKGENTRLINISAKINGMLLDNYFCDGIIVSTPTGSTAYSMSAGGPILSPDIEGLIVNPISSHSLHSRPVVISDKSEVTLECSKLNSDCQLVVDGELCEKVGNNQKLLIKKSECKASFIRTKNYNFYEILLKKLNKWGVTENKE